jgi:predicted ATP-dependent serine protease
MEGARPVLAEIQALVVGTSGSNPRRTSNGFDYNRFAMLLAVLDKRGGLKVSACDAYLNIIGGLWLDEPAADLAAVIALASSYLDRPVPGDLVAVGEVGLTGELRSVSHLEQRISEITGWLPPGCVVPRRRTGAPDGAAGLDLSRPGISVRRSERRWARGNEVDAGAAQGGYARRGGAVQGAHAVLLVHALAGTGDQAHEHHPF